MFRLKKLGFLDKSRIFSEKRRQYYQEMISKVITSVKKYLNLDNIVIDLLFSLTPLYTTFAIDNFNPFPNNEQLACQQGRFNF